MKAILLHLHPKKPLSQPPQLIAEAKKDVVHIQAQ